MGKKYMALYYDYLEATEGLSDAECGRLFRACLTYGKTGAVTELPGSEKFVFPLIRSNMDREGARYDKKCETNRKNIKSRWKKEDNTNVYDRIQSNTNVYDPIRTSSSSSLSLSSSFDVSGVDVKDVDVSFDVQEGCIGVTDSGGPPIDTSPCPKTKPNPKAAKVAFLPPGHLADIWPDYLAGRDRKRAVKSNRALELIVGKLNQLAPGDEGQQRAILEQSIVSGWIDVFPLKNVAAGYRNESTEERDRRTNERIAKMRKEKGYDA